MIRFILVVLLTTTLIVGIVLDISSNESNISSNDYEDYGCIHEDHSQFDDGDGLNLNFISK